MNLERAKEIRASLPGQRSRPSTEPLRLRVMPGGDLMKLLVRTRGP